MAKPSTEAQRFPALRTYVTSDETTSDSAGQEALLTEQKVLTPEALTGGLPGVVSDLIRRVIEWTHPQNGTGPK